MTGARGSAGGAAMGGGAEFQARVAAWAAVHVLAEADSHPPFDLTSPAASVGCEGKDPVDDVLVRTGTGHSAYLQVKTTLSLSERRKDTRGRLLPLASAIDQFVRQVLCGSGSATALDEVGDRLLLVVGSQAPSTIRRTLKAVLDRIRLQPESSPLAGPTLSADERRAVEIVARHMKQSWHEATGTEPNDRVIHQFLRLVRVEALELDAGGPAEQTAKTLLRMSVLQEPGNADQAWALLVNIGHRLIGTRASIDRLALVRELLRAGIQVRAPRSYREDVDRLQRHSARVTARLSDDASIPLGAARVEIIRPYVATLRPAVEDGPLLVVGEPGAGKSGVMYGLARAFTSESRDVVLLTTQDPPFRTLGELRDELRLAHEIVDVLANWPGDQPAFLLIDALDAARTDAATRALRDLMSVVADRAPRWRVLASIREYDVRYGREVQQLFRGEPPAGGALQLPGPEFARVRHVVIGRLSDSELAQLELSAPSLHAFVRSAPLALSDLLRNSFNLRLAAELLDSGTNPQEIRDLQTQINLLDLYWGKRVLGAGEAREASAREAVLRKAVAAMVGERSLRVDRDQVDADPAAAPALADLLSAHALVEWSPGGARAARRASLTFPHHVLFDYAVARLLLRRDPKRLVHSLTSDPALVLLARPSLVMHFQYLWGLDADGGGREEFWRAVLAIAGAPSIPEIGKLIGPGVAAEAAQEIEEFGPLLVALTAPDGQVRASAENAFNHIVRSLAGRVDYVRDRSALWCELLDQVSEHLVDGTAYGARALLYQFAERVDELKPEGRAQIGQASRRLLDYAWRRPLRDRWLVTHSIQYVSRTFSTDALASAALLRRAIERDHLAAHGSEELLWIAEGVRTFVTVDPDIVRDIYVAAFSYRETSDAPTPMGGIVLRMVSNRRQDYEGGLHGLERAFPDFLKAAPEQAVLALNAAVESYIAREHRRDQEEPIGFQILGREAQIQADYSHIWDQGRAHPDEAIQLLDHLGHRIDTLAKPDGDHQKLQHLLAVIVRTSRRAVVWRRLLRVATHHPETVGLELRELAWSLPILKCDDTSTPGGDLIRSISPHLPEGDRERIERTILSISEGASEEHRESAERIRDRLLGCIPESSLATNEARKRLEVLRAKNSVPPNEDSPFFDVTSRPYGEAEYLAEQGVPVNEEPNRRVRDFEEPVKNFASTHLNTVPDPAAILEIFPQLRALRDLLKTAALDGVHVEQANHAWGTLAEACAAVAKAPNLSCRDHPGALVREVLLEASYHEVPRVERTTDSQFDRPFWSKPAARIDAAAGLAMIAFNLSCFNDEILAAIDRLSRDPSPAVRYQVAIRLRTLYGHSEEECWTLVERMASEDQSPGVLRGLLESTLYPLRFKHSDRVARVAIGIFERTAEWPTSENVRTDVVAILVDLCIAGKHARATEIVQHIAANPLRHLEQAAHLAAGLRDILVDGPTDGSDARADAGRGRAIELLLRLTRSAAEAFRRGVQAAETEDKPGDKQTEKLAWLLDGVGANLYFVSGAHADNESAGPDPKVKARLLREAGSIIDVLVAVGLPSLTHHLLETLEVLIPFEPRGVFMRVAAAVRGGEKGGYQYDHMAEEVLVRIVERYFAEHREIFQSDEDARKALIEILDTFVQAGSVGARRLSYGLDGIFR